MASIEFKGIEQYSKMLQQMANPKQVEAICKYSIYDAAGMVLEEVRKATPERTGDLRRSLVTTPMQNKDGFVYEQLDFAGYDRNGVPNMLKARAIESGTSKLRKKPFVRPTVRRVKKLAEFMMEKSMDEYLTKFMKAKE